MSDKTISHTSSAGSNPCERLPAELWFSIVEKAGAGLPKERRKSLWTIATTFPTLSHEALRELYSRVEVTHDDYSRFKEWVKRYPERAKMIKHITFGSAIDKTDYDPDPDAYLDHLDDDTIEVLPYLENLKGLSYSSDNFTLTKDRTTSLHPRLVLENNPRVKICLSMPSDKSDHRRANRIGQEARYYGQRIQNYHTTCDTFLHLDCLSDDSDVPPREGYPWEIGTTRVFGKASNAGSDLSVDLIQLWNIRKGLKDGDLTVCDSPVLKGSIELINRQHLLKSTEGQLRQLLQQWPAAEENGDRIHIQKKGEKAGSREPVSGDEIFQLFFTQEDLSEEYSEYDLSFRDSDLSVFFQKATTKPCEVCGTEEGW